MKIGFDVSQTGRFKTGCGHFAESLARQLIATDRDSDYILYPTFGNGYWDPDWPKATLNIRDNPKVSRGLGHGRLDKLEAFWLNPPPDHEARLGSPDVIHSNNFFCPTGLERAQLVYTLHDLAFASHSEWTSDANWRVCFEGVFNASVYADHIVAVSDFTRGQFLRMFPHFPEERISVVYESSRFGGPRDQPSPRHLRHLRPGQFWLAAGSQEPRKNLERLVDAYTQLKASGETTYPLVLYGGPAVSGRNEDDVLRLGYVDDTALQWLYQNCTAFCYPSLFEGFGLPVIEAMSLGAAIVTSNVTSIPEVIGDAGILIDPEDVASIYAGMCLLARDETAGQRLRSAALARSKRFSWTTAASAVLDVYRGVTNEYPRSIERKPLGLGAAAT